MRSERLRAVIVEGPVTAALLSLAIPTIASVASAALFNLVDTYWVSRIGSSELAAMGFIFPVVYVIGGVMVGLGVGAASTAARAIGARDRDGAARIAAHGLLLAASLGVALSIVGIAAGDAIFSLLGAGEEMRPLVGAFMTPWFAGLALIALSSLCISLIRAAGDARTPSLIVVGGVVLNIVLDPLFIFGLGPVPGYGMTGAAIATVVANGASAGAGLLVLARSHDLLRWHRGVTSGLLRSWKVIANVGLHSSSSVLMQLVSFGVLTNLLADISEGAVGALAVGMRVQIFVLAPVWALALSIPPYVGQNLGAGRLQRVRDGLARASGLTLAYSLAVAVVLAIGAEWIARTFTSDSRAIAAIVAFLRIIPITFGGLGVALVIGNAFYAALRPLRSTLMFLVWHFGLTIPLAWWGAARFGVTGVFGAIACANLGVSCLAIILKRPVFDSGSATSAEEKPEPRG